MRWPWRRPPDPLGEGVWRRAHDRFGRAVDRYHQMLAGVPDGDPRAALERSGAVLAGALDDVRALCEQAQATAPSTGLDVPGGQWSVVHRRVSQAANLVAQAAEAAALVRVAASRPAGAGGDPPAPDTAAVERAVQQVVDLLRDVRGSEPGRTSPAG